MKLDQESSTRLNLLRFLPIVGVVYIHAYGTEVAFRTGTVGLPPDQLAYWADFIRIFVTQCLARIAVPIFFMMAGYFLLLNFKWSFSGFVKKIQARGSSLFIPFLLWNAAMMVFLVIMQTIPATQPYFTYGGPRILEYTTLYEYLDGLIGLDGMPLNYHFWFIRDLILMLVLLAPILSFMCRYAPKQVFNIFLILFFGYQYICWVSNTWPIRMPDVPAVLFFSVGGLCATKNVSLFSLDKFGPAALVIWFISLFPDTIWQSGTPESVVWLTSLFSDTTYWQTHPLAFNNIFHRTFIPVGVVGALYATKLIMHNAQLSQTLVGLGGASFFVYAAHEPTLGIARLLAYQWLPLCFPINSLSIILIFLLVPALVIWFVLIWYRTWGKVSPNTLAWFTGGR